jgi:hypothetical protein
MAWNYRIVRYRNGTGYGLHEVFYDADGKPTGMTEKPATFGCDADQDPVEEIMRSLDLAYYAARKSSILDEASPWPEEPNAETKS